MTQHDPESHPAPEPTDGPHPEPDTGSVPQPTDAQRRKLAARLGKRDGGTDRGEVMPRTAAALALVNEKEDKGLEALVAALADERVIVAVQVEKPHEHPALHVSAGPVPKTDDEIDFEHVPTDIGPALAVFTSVAALAAHDPAARPMPLAMRTVALTALAETGGHVLVDPAGAAILLPRPAVAAIAQGDSWLPAWRDPELLAELRERTGASFDEPVMDLQLEYAGGIDVRVNVLSNPALEPTVVRAALDRAFEAIQSSPRLGVAAERVVLTPKWAYPA